MNSSEKPSLTALDESSSDNDISFTKAYNRNVENPKRQAINYEKPMKSCLFGNGENPKFLHPSTVTYNSDFAIEIRDKTILLHKNVLVERVPYFNTFGEDSDFIEINQKVKITDDVSKKSISVNKITLQDCSFDAELVCEYFSFVYNEEVIFSDRMLDLFEISDFFCDLKVSKIILSQYQIDSDNLSFAWKHEALRDGALAYIINDQMKNRPLELYTTAHVRGGWEHLSTFYTETMTMTAEVLVDFIGELKSHNKIEDNMYAYFVIKWLQENSVQKKTLLKVSEVLSKNEVYSTVDKEIQDSIYTFMTSTDEIDKETKYEIYEYLYGEPMLENSQKRQKILDKLLRIEGKDKSDKEVDVKIEADDPNEPNPVGNDPQGNTQDLNQPLQGQVIRVRRRRDNRRERQDNVFRIEILQTQINNLRRKITADRNRLLERFEFEDDAGRTAYRAKVREIDRDMVFLQQILLAVDMTNVRQIENFEEQFRIVSRNILRRNRNLIPIREGIAGLGQQQDQPVRRVRNRLLNDDQQVARAEVNLQHNPSADNNRGIIRPRHLDQNVRDYAQRENNQDQQPANPVVNLDNPAVAVNVQVPPPIRVNIKGLAIRAVQKDKNKKRKQIASGTMPFNTELDRVNETPKPKKKKKSVSFTETEKQSKDKNSK